MQSNNSSWRYGMLIFLGLWLIATAFSFTSNSSLIFGSDIICGILLILLGLYALYSHHTWPFWAMAAVGIWLQFAPLVFWAPEAVSYINNTLIGVLAITFSLLIPFQNSSFADNPHGWTFNPSAWHQRLPTIILCTLCWFLARYMAAYQLGYLDHIWDPVFGSEGTLQVITSPLSKSFPISDAGLGALVYTLEMLLGCKGGPNRWHAMPWIVLAFGLLVVPAGLVSILLIISQPIIVGHWCFWCLLTALFMLFMIAFTIDEVIAVIQYLIEIKRENKLSLWSVFWEGGSSPANPSNALSKNKIVGVSYPWNLALSFIIGIWILFSAPYFHYEGHPAMLFSILGALTVTFTVFSFSEALRSLRLINILFGLLLLLTVYHITGHTYGSINGVICGLALIILSFPKGEIRQSYGPWNKYII
jgi:uncharacterized membrane protein